jgi:hypothetical protein
MKAFLVFVLSATVGCSGAGTGGGGGTGGAANTGGRGGMGGAAGTGGRGGMGGAAGTGGRGGASGAPAADGGAGTGAAGSPGGAWSVLSVMAVVNPMDHGAVGDGVADDLAPLGAAVNALPAAGGIVYLPEGAAFKKTNLLVVTRSHVKFWAPNRQAELYQSVAGQRRRQAILCRNNAGCGFFGVAFRSDAAARFDALEDNQIAADHASLVEVVGCDIRSSAAVGVFLYGSTEHYVEGNYVHHTWADQIHHTSGARQSWVWNNFILNDQTSKGDDGVACVTYGPTSTRCADMEWWRNTILGTGWGRGYAVIGGDDIHIHDNWAIGVAGAGLIVASEPGYDSASSQRIVLANNYIYRSAHTIGHPGILISGQNTAAQPLDRITLTDNVSAETVTGTPYRAEGAFTNVTNTGLATTAAALPSPIPTMADIRIGDTAVLRTRDVSHVGAAFRTGLYRIHVRRAPSGGGFQQRFEYIVKGAPDAVTTFASAQTATGAVLSEQRTVGAVAFALLLAPAPVAVPGTLAPVPFRDLRAGDLAGDLSWLWQRIDTGMY